MGLFSKALSSVGGLLNNITGVTDTAKRSYDYSVNLANQQQANNIALWNMQNEYNTPAAQIARMAQAGIDINPMTYAVGNGTMSSTAQNISPASYHSPNFGSPGNPFEMAMNVMQGIAALKQTEANTEQTKENTKLTKAKVKAEKRRVKVIERTGIDPQDSGPVGWVAAGANAIADMYQNLERGTFNTLERIFGKRGGYKEW